MTGPPPGDGRPGTSPADPELGRIEVLLRRMPLRRPGRPLDDRVRRVVRRRRWFERSRVVGLLLAAVVAVAVGAAPLLRRLIPAATPPVATRPVPAGRDGTDPAKGQAPLRTAAQEGENGPSGPVRVERTITHVADDGVVGQMADVPLQRFRRQSVRQVWLVDPQTGGRTAVTIPTEEILVVRLRPL
jgi:hypothetical protein